MKSEVRLAVAAGVTLAIVGAPRTAKVQSSDTAAPVVAEATLSPQGPVQYGTGTAGTTTVRGTGDGAWNTNKDGITVTLSATDNVGVVKFQYAVVTAAPTAGGPGGGGGRGGGGRGGPGGAPGAPG